MKIQKKEIKQHKMICKYLQRSLSFRLSFLGLAMLYLIALLAKYPLNPTNLTIHKTKSQKRSTDKNTKLKWDVMKISLLDFKRQFSVKMDNDHVEI